MKTVLIGPGNGHRAVRVVRKTQRPLLELTYRDPHTRKLVHLVMRPTQADKLRRDAKHALRELGWLE